MPNPLFAIGSELEVSTDHSPEHQSVSFHQEIGSRVTSIASPSKNPQAGVATVSSADEVVRLTTSASCTRVLIKAPSDNGKTVYIGPSTVTSSTGFPLDPDAPVLELHINNENKLYITAAAASQTVRWLAI